MILPGSGVSLKLGGFGKVPGGRHELSRGQHQSPRGSEGLPAEIGLPHSCIDVLKMAGGYRAVGAWHASTASRFLLLQERDRVEAPHRRRKAMRGTDDAKVQFLRC